MRTFTEADRRRAYGRGHEDGYQKGLSVGHARTKPTNEALKRSYDKGYREGSNDMAEYWKSRFRDMVKNCLGENTQPSAVKEAIVDKKEFDWWDIAYEIPGMLGSSAMKCCSIYVNDTINEIDLEFDEKDNFARRYCEENIVRLQGIVSKRLGFSVRLRIRQYFDGEVPF